VGEFAAHEAAASNGRRPNNLYSALCEAAYMTGLERNSDVVAMASYAPLMARDGMQQWTPDLIWFNAKEVLLTPNYYVQQMFGVNLGAQVVESSCDSINQLVYHVVTRTEDKLYVKLVNVSEYPETLTLQLAGVPDGEGTSKMLTGERNAVNTFHRKYCPQHEVPFGETMDVPSTLGSIRLYASPVDWGAGEYVKWMEDYHFAAKPQNIHSGMATEVINGNCLWMRVSYAGRSVLFTGDTNKKFEDRNDEALDLFIARYGEELRSDIVKFPHHGRGRDAACAPCKAHLMTDTPLSACILSGVDGPELAGKVLDTMNVPWYDLNTSDAAYVIKDSGMEKII